MMIFSFFMLTTHTVFAILILSTQQQENIMNFMRELELKARRQTLNGYVKKLDTGFRALKKTHGFAAARLTQDHHDSGQIRSELAEAKLGEGTLESNTPFAYSGIIKRGWTTIPEQTAIFWNSTLPESRQLIVTAMQSAGLTVANPDAPNEAVIVKLSDAA